MTTIGFLLTVSSKFCWVSSTVATRHSFRKKWAVYSLDLYVHRAVRPVAHRAFAHGLARCRTGELARCSCGGRPLDGAHRGPRPAALRTRRRRRNPALARAIGPRLRQRDRLPKRATKAISGRPAAIARTDLLVQLHASRDRRFVARPGR